MSSDSRDIERRQQGMTEQLSDPFAQKAEAYHKEAARDDIVARLQITSSLLRRLGDKFDHTAGSVKNNGDMSQVEEAVDSLVRSIPNWHLLELMSDLIRYHRRDGGN